MQSDNSMFRIPVDMTSRAEETVAQSATVAEKPLQSTLDSSPMPIENKATTTPDKAVVITSAPAEKVVETVVEPQKTVVDIYAELSAISEEVMACRNAVLSKA